MELIAPTLLNQIPFMQLIMNIGMKGLIGPMMMMMIMMMKVNNITSERCHLKLNQQYTHIIIPKSNWNNATKKKNTNIDYYTL